MKLWLDILLVLHLIGVGALLSGFFYQLRDWGKGMKVNAGIIHGAWLQFITGMGMVGLIQAMGNNDKLNNLVLLTKLLVLVLIFVVAYMYNKKEVTPKWVVPVIALLTTVNIALAVLGPIYNG